MQAVHYKAPPPTRMEIRELSVLSYAYPFTFWHYRTSHALADVLRDPGAYFADCIRRRHAGDMMLISASDGGAQIFWHTLDRAEVMTRTAAAQDARVAA